jgi:hypothetical protein
MASQQPKGNFLVNNFANDLSLRHYNKPIDSLKDYQKKEIILMSEQRLFEIFKEDDLIWLCVGIRKGKK